MKMAPGRTDQYSVVVACVGLQDNTPATRQVKLKITNLIKLNIKQFVLD